MYVVFFTYLCGMKNLILVVKWIRFCTGFLLGVGIIALLLEGVIGYGVNKGVLFGDFIIFIISIAASMIIDNKLSKMKKLETTVKLAKSTVKHYIKIIEVDLKNYLSDRGYSEGEREIWESSIANAGFEKKAKDFTFRLLYQPLEDRATLCVILNREDVRSGLDCSISISVKTFYSRDFEDLKYMEKTITKLYRSLKNSHLKKNITK